MSVSKGARQKIYGVNICLPIWYVNWGVVCPLKEVMVFRPTHSGSFPELHKCLLDCGECGPIQTLAEW